MVTNSQAPFLVTTAPGSARSIQRQLQTQPGSNVNGYFPEGSIVRVHDNSILERMNPMAMLQVTVLSVPDERLDYRFSYGVNSYETVREGTGTRATPGMQGYISSTDLWLPPAARTANPENSVFQVRRDSARFGLQGLDGRAVRLARRTVGFSDMYLYKRCCAEGQSDSYYEQFMSGVGYYINNNSSIPHEASRDPLCSYTPVYEVLRNTNTNASQQPNFVSDFLISPTANNCDAFTSTLQTVSRENLRAVASMANIVGRLNQQDLEIIQRRVWDGAIAPISDSSGRSRGRGNQSKELCAKAVRTSLQSMGLLDQDSQLQGRPVHAKDYHPWLARNGFTDITAAYDCNPNTAPPGSVIVYNGGSSGHIEIKVGIDGYCSDYCSNTPISESTRIRRTCAAIYMPNRRPR